MASYSKSNNVHHIRSISLPSCSHPSILQIEEEVNKLKTWESSSMATAEKIYNGFTGLEKLYICIDDLLSLPLTQQALSHHQGEKWVDELLDQSMRLLDICGSTRDFMFLVLEQVRDLQSALRRRKGDSCIESNIAKYTSFRSKMKKDANRLIAALIKIDNRIVASPLLDLDHHLVSVIRVMKEVSALNISMVQSLLFSLCVPASTIKSIGWSMISKLIHKEASTRADQSKISDDLESQERHIKLAENGLDCIFRSLIKTRAVILNILSH